MKTFSSFITIKQCHLDLYGHVNNAQYLNLYEQARWQLIALENIDENVVLKEQQGPVILNLSVSFKKELVLNDAIEIKLTEAIKKNKMLITVKQVILKDLQIVSEIELLLGIMDLKKRKLVLPEQKWLKALGI